MSDTLKPMPLAAVIYVATFDDAGRPTVQAKIHTDTAGRTIFEGDAAKAYTLLDAAMTAVGRRLAISLTDQLVRTLEEKRLLNAELMRAVDSPFNSHTNSMP